MRKILILLGLALALGTPSATTLAQEGACCLPDGSCTVTNSEACAIAGGQYNAELPCGDVVCEEPSTGSCCLPDGTCLDGVTETMCMASGGAFDATLPCGDVVCEAPPETGSCCLSDGNCVNGVTAEYCAFNGGSFDSLLPCGDRVCEQPPVECSPGYWKNHTDVWFGVLCNSAAWPASPTCAEILADLRARGGGGNEIRRRTAGTLLNDRWVQLFGLPLPCDDESY